MVKVKDKGASTATEESPSSGRQGRKQMSLTAPNKEIDSIKAAELLQRRRTSASVDEIRNLYSALQELVPGTSGFSSPTRVNSPDSKATGVSSNRNSPLPQRQLFGNGSTETSNSASSAVDDFEHTQPNNNNDTPRVKRILPVTSDSPASSRKLNSRMIQALDVNANHSPKKGKRSPNLGRRGSSGEVLLGMHHNQGSHAPNMGRRGSSGEVLLNVRTNQSKPRSPLARQRGPSNSDVTDGLQSNGKPANSTVPNPNKSSDKLDRLLTPDQSSEGVSPIPNMDKSRKKLSPLLVTRRGSCGDVLTVETKNRTPAPCSPLAQPRRGSMYDVREPTSPSPDGSSPRRGSWANALTKFSSSFKWKKHSKSPERKENESHEDEADGTDGQPTKKLTRLESQMDLLLNSLNDLQGPSKQTLRVSASDPEISKKLELRRGSLGTEMQQLLGALQELSTMTPSSDSDSLGETEPRSRCGSELQSSAPVQRESLDQLEAYFSEKLRDATKGKTSKTPSERSSESDAPHSDKEDGEPLPSYAESSSMEASLDVGSIDEGIDIVDHPTIHTSASDPDLKRTAFREDRHEFANQVNRKLQDWLTKAVALSVQEKSSGVEYTSESEDTKDGSLDSEDSDSNKAKETKSKMKKSILSKLSFLHRGDKRRRMKYKHRRTRSMHDIAFTFENEHYLDDENLHDFQKPAKTAKPVEKSRRSSVSRSKSMYDVTSDRSKGRTKREAAVNVQTYQANDTPPCKAAIQRSFVAKCSSQKDCDTQIVHMETPMTSISPSVKPETCRNTTSSKSTAQKKRLFRLPTNLPIFYTPGTEKSIADRATRGSLKHGKKSFPNTGGVSEIFYSEKPADSAKLKKLPSDPRHLNNTRTNYFFGSSPATDFSGQSHKAVKLFYQGASPASSNLRRFASHESFLTSRDFEGSEKSRARDPYHYGNELTVNNAGQRVLISEAVDTERDSSRAGQACDRWDMEFTV